MDSRSRQLARRDSRRQQRSHRLDQIRSSPSMRLAARRYANGMEQQCSWCVALQMPPAAPGTSTSRGALRVGHSRAASSARGLVSIISGCGLHPRRPLRIDSIVVLGSAQHRAPRSGACPRRELQLDLREVEGGRVSRRDAPDEERADEATRRLSAAVMRWGPAGTPHCPRAYPRRIPTARRPCCWPGQACLC